MLLCFALHCIAGDATGAVIAVTVTDIAAVAAVCVFAFFWLIHSKHSTIPFAVNGGKFVLQCVSLTE